MNLTYLFKKSWRCIVMQHRSCDLVSERACTILLINAFQWFPLKIICVTKCHCASNVTCLWKEVTTWTSQDVSHIRPQKQRKQLILIILKKKIVSSFSRIWYKNDFFFFAEWWIFEALLVLITHRLFTLLFFTLLTGDTLHSYHTKTKAENLPIASMTPSCFTRMRYESN